MRKYLFYLHLILGLSAGFVIALLALTGIVMSLETSMIERSERALVERSVVTSADKTMMLGAIYRQASVNHPQLKQPSIALQSDPRMPFVFQEMRGDKHYYHPVTGVYLGQGDLGLTDFFRKVTALHRWLIWQAPQRDGPGAGKPSAWRVWGGRITAAACMIYFILTMTGLLLWWHRVKTVKAFKAKLFWNRALKKRARNWNLHHVFGIWASPLILATTITGLIIAYPWANAGLYSLFSETVPVRESQEGRKSGGRQNHEGKATAHGVVVEFADGDLEQIKKLVSEALPSWQSLSMQASSHAGKSRWQVQARDAGRGRPDRAFRWEVDYANDGEQAILTNSSGGDGPGTKAAPSKASQARQWVRWIHTGEAGGWWGMCLAALTCVATVVLTWTGLALSWRRFFPKKNKSNGTPIA